MTKVSSDILQPADRLDRRMHDLRISVTDRCNFRCVYCMPRSAFGHGYPFLPRQEILAYEEIVRIAHIFVSLGVGKIRLTGGEPLLRKDIERLIEQLARLPGIELTLTTNGALLAARARGLRDAGLQRVTVSLDALDDAISRRMNDADYPVAKVLAGIDAAGACGLAPVKINMVVKRGTNDSEILPMARHFRGAGHILRFIEYMDVGNTNAWNLTEVVPSAEVVQRIAGEFPVEPVEPNYAGEVAERWRYRDGAGEIGVVSSVTQAFCSECSRVRLATNGRLYTCLFASSGHDLRKLLRGGTDDEQLRTAIAAIWMARNDRYSALRQAGLPVAHKIEMSYIGG